MAFDAGVNVLAFAVEKAWPFLQWLMGTMWTFFYEDVPAFVRGKDFAGSARTSWALIRPYLASMVTVVSNQALRLWAAASAAAYALMASMMGLLSTDVLASLLETMHTMLTDGWAVVRSFLGNLWFGGLLLATALGLLISRLESTKQNKQPAEEEAKVCTACKLLLLSRKAKQHLVWGMAFLSACSDL